MMDGLKTQLTEGLGLWFTGTLEEIKRHNLAKGLKRERQDPYLGKQLAKGGNEEDDLLLARTKPVPAAAPKRARVPAP